MRTYPRIRKMVKWGGAALCVLILVMWGVSGWWWGRAVASNGWAGGWGQGLFGIGWFAPPIPFVAGIVAGAESNPPTFRWWFELVLSGRDWVIRIPFWAIAAPLAGITAAAWRLDTLARRRARAGLCLKCQYDRAGLAPGAVCPECGAAPPAPQAKA